MKLDNQIINAITLPTFLHTDRFDTFTLLVALTLLENNWMDITDHWTYLVSVQSDENENIQNVSLALND